MRKFLATLLALVMTLALMVPASWGENKETYQLPDSLEGKTVILHTNDVHGAIDKYAKVAALRDECGSSDTFSGKRRQRLASPEKIWFCDYQSTVW